MITLPQLSPADITLQPDGAVNYKGDLREFVASRIEVASLNATIAQGSNTGCINTFCGPEMPNSKCVNAACHVTGPTPTGS
jgi:hypothetical protein